MTREEAIKIIEVVFKSKETYKYYSSVTHQALNMAIEALSQPIVAKHFDIQSGYIYCSSEIAENVKVVVRCKDCKWYKKIVEKSKSGLCHYDIVARCLHDEDYCSHGERREP